jgi:hypothetical protein
LVPKEDVEESYKRDICEYLWLAASTKLLKKKKLQGSVDSMMKRHSWEYCRDAAIQIKQERDVATTVLNVKVAWNLACYPWHEPSWEEREEGGSVFLDNKDAKAPVGENEDTKEDASVASETVSGKGPADLAGSGVEQSATRGKEEGWLATPNANARKNEAWEDEVSISQDAKTQREEKEDTKENAPLWPNERSDAAVASETAARGKEESWLATPKEANEFPGGEKDIEESAIAGKENDWLATPKEVGGLAGERGEGDTAGNEVAEHLYAEVETFLKEINASPDDRTWS